MLKRLELAGFKSFADKTAFDFPAGITAIVGPNGSGKSNVVDGVRWVLGEQSAKSLRGGEMADVIFNGSASRKSLGLAEVTMTFDNSRKALATDAEEVQISRRVYRSGEGEYLINGQICRLKDVKNLFLGSGAGTDAYSIIEQGRVDVLLQASTKDRRTIFEEAAGISRFKAKKTETLRRLERVDQNVQRLKDILDEVEKQLRSVKLQAAKAQRYQEYSARLRELRVGLGLQEYRDLSQQLEIEQKQLRELRGGLEHQTTQMESWERELQEWESTLQTLGAGAAEQQSRLSEARQHIAAGNTTWAHEWSTSADLEADLAKTNHRLTNLSLHVSALAESAEAALQEMRTVEENCREQGLVVSDLEGELSTSATRLDELQTQIVSDKESHVEQMRTAARWHNDVVSFKGQFDSLQREYDRLRQRTAQVEEHLASIDLELQELTRAEEGLQTRLSGARQNLVEHRQDHDRLAELSDATRQTIADLKAQRSGLTSRIEVLDGLERSHEGLGAGVREVFALLEQQDPGPWRSVLGMTADFLTVRREHAPLIDLALGEAAQRFLVRDAAQLDEALRNRGKPFSSRVSFLPLSRSPGEGRPRPTSSGKAETGLAAAGFADRVAGEWDSNGLLSPGVVAPADKLVAADRADLADLPAFLLGRTLVVRDLATARALASRARGWRFVTVQGELLEDDGTVTVGTHYAEIGILSRKSELRELREQLVALDERIAECERDLADLRDRVHHQEAAGQLLQDEIHVLAEQHADLRSRLNQHRHQREGLHEEAALSQSEIHGVEQELQNSADRLNQARVQAEAAENEVHRLHARMMVSEIEARTLADQRQQAQGQLTSAKVALAHVEERLEAQRIRLSQVQGDLDQRQTELRQTEIHLCDSGARLWESHLTLLRTSASLAESYCRKEGAEHRLQTLDREAEQARTNKAKLTDQMLAVRATWREHQELAHARELAVNDLTHRRATLLERVREDYQLDLAAELQKSESQSPVEAPAPGDSATSMEPRPERNPVLDADQVNEEIGELRKKLGRLGSVNLESLQELAELESRASSLQAQYDDLAAAKKSLEDIIGQINTDSRKLFSETFQTIRIHFQELFRKLFGGGMADVILEDEIDILESGIEINARPPGKELRSISLMSGGEKTMTAVALLLAIFRSKPSPFCILDEVDAALDEANIGRFTSVLRDFLDRSQFIIVTHSKRTMGVADVLYGVTMQESGISKRVAVRFEDWPNETTAAIPADSNATVTNP